MADINKALKLSLGHRAAGLRGALRLDDGDIRGAMHDAETILKAEPDSAAALALRGAAYARAKDYDRALADLDKAIAADGNDALAYGERGQVYLAQERQRSRASPISAAPSSSAPSAPRPTAPAR